jgi:hypothetical protein
MPDYIMTELELLHPGRLRQCSSLMPEYIIRELELLSPERLRQCSSVIIDYMDSIQSVCS